MEKVLKALSKVKSLIILPHVNADGDALGSALGFAIALSKTGKVVDVLLEEPVQKTLSFIPGQSMTIVYDFKNYVEKVPDAVISIDLGDSRMLGDRGLIYENAKLRINIDHHATNNIDADLAYVDVKASAVGEIIYEMLEKMSISMDKDVATCLYTAILTDTGGFKYTNTTSRTHRIASQLLEHGVDVAGISKRVFDTVSYSKMFLIKKTLNNMKLLHDNKIAVSCLFFEDISMVNAQPDDFEGLVNFGRNLEETEVSLVLREIEPQVFKGSIRSNNYVDVTDVAKVFSGGGHTRAAGFTAKGIADEILDKAILEIEKQININ